MHIMMYLYIKYTKMNIEFNKIVNRYYKDKNNTATVLIVYCKTYLKSQSFEAIKLGVYDATKLTSNRKHQPT